MTEQQNKGEYSAIIVGGGPAGLAIAETFQRAGVDYVLYEKGPIAGHIAEYPTFMDFFSTNENLEIARFPLGNTGDKPSRREYLHYLTNFARYHRLNVETWTAVTGVERGADGTFCVRTRTQDGRTGETTAPAVVLAVGAWEAPRKLAIPGGDLPKVHYRYTESHLYVGKKVLVVGGRNSAIDTALSLWRNGAEVTLSYRRRDFNGVGVKYWLRPDIENRIANGEIPAFLGSHVERIGPGFAEIRTHEGTLEKIENDFVLPCLGYDPPVGFLRAAGVELEPETNRPLHNPETLESTIPGLFVAGVITNGNVSGKVFIENSRHHGELILPRLREILSESTVGANQTGRG